MRIYIPATAADLSAPEISARPAHAATAQLARALPEEDEEGLEMSASLCAANASLVLLAEPSADGAADRRIVIAADINPAQGASGSVGAVAVVDGLVAALVAGSGGPGLGQGQPVGDVLVGVVVVSGADHVGDA